MLFVYSCVVVLDTNSHRYGVPLKIIVWGKKEKAMFDILREAWRWINRPVIANRIEVFADKCRYIPSIPNEV